jgi:hypothetical protein
MKKLRLLLFRDCNRSCEGCCNKGIDFDKVPVIDNFDTWDEVYLTGGEPMLHPEIVRSTIGKFPITTKLYMYTAKVDELYDTINLLKYHLEGITLTLHEPKDLDAFIILNNEILANRAIYSFSSLRLNVFKEVVIPSYVDLSMWKVKDNMVWIVDCPVPADEVFMKL